MAAAFAFGEALVLGLASGPACVASCGPVVVPSLLTERTGFCINVRYLSAFLGTRLLGYLVFAAVAWQLGSLVSFQPLTRSWVFGSIQLLLACVLIRYAHSAGRACAGPSSNSELVTIAKAGKHRVPGAAVLGFLTGVSLCPPFAVAGVRAAQMANMAAALLFFTVFFLGTSAWFVPFASLGWLKRNEAVTTVGRMAMTLIALYYFYMGLMVLIARNGYGY